MYIRTGIFKGGSKLMSEVFKDLITIASLLKQASAGVAFHLLTNACERGASFISLNIIRQSTHQLLPLGFRTFLTKVLNEPLALVEDEARNEGYK